MAPKQAWDGACQQQRSGNGASEALKEYEDWV